MTRRIAVGMLVALALGVAVPAVALAADLTPEVQVSPNVLRLDSAGTWVTIHVDVPYSAVTDCMVAINSQPVPITIAKPDLQGNLVLKLKRTAVVEVVEPGWVPVVVSGVLAGDVTFMGAKDYLVRAPADQGQTQTKKQSQKQNRNRNQKNR